MRATLFRSLSPAQRTPRLPRVWRRYRNIASACLTCVRRAPDDVTTWVGRRGRRPRPRSPLSSKQRTPLKPPPPRRCPPRPPRKAASCPSH
eukprot:6447497-Pyramimonas_sp.AAC.3